jgi:hypothetical protein
MPTGAMRPARGHRAALGAVDVGQGAWWQQGLCLAVEALPGTDAMLEGGRPARGPAPRPARGRGCVTRRRSRGRTAASTCPRLAPQPCARVAAAGLGGLAWEAGGVILNLDRAGTMFLCCGRDWRACSCGRATARSPAMKLFLIAGEPSGDRLGAALMAGLKALGPV